jgi:heat shock protein HtpX
MIAVTTGLLRELDRTELEGVLAHEIGHIRNRDTRVNSIATVVVAAVGTAGVTALSVAAAIGQAESARRSSDDQRSDGAGLGVVAFLIGPFLLVVALPMTMLVRAALSRRRETLADLAAVELTRYPTGLRRALERIAESPNRLEQTPPALAHLWLASPIPWQGWSWWRRRWDTHPPLEDRIAALRRLEGLPGAA